MKVRGSELTAVIRHIVREEVVRLLPGMVKECLAEVYIRRIVAEQGERPRKLAEVLVDDLPDEPDDDVPAPPKNDHRGIYNQQPDPRPTNEAARKLLDRNNPLSFLYEDVRPISSDPTLAPSSNSDVPLESLGADFGKMKRLVDGMERKTAGAVPQVVANDKLRELERRRKLLDIPAFPESSDLSAGWKK